MRYVLEEGVVWKSPVIYDLAVSAAAQHMIFSASQVYRDCENGSTLGIRKNGKRDSRILC